MPVTSIKSASAAALSLFLGTTPLSHGHGPDPDAGAPVPAPFATAAAFPVPPEEPSGRGPRLIMLAQADSQSSANPSGQDVDESALRYFARQGDTRRLEIEIGRLRALYPGWTPPADLLSAPTTTDTQLDEIWELYSRGRLAEARQKIAERQASESGWQAPEDLLSRLALAESRERLVNASELNQFDTVITIASGNPELLTCGEVDVLWRVAEAFASTEREQRADDTYRYILTNCDNSEERLATIQNAYEHLPLARVNELLKLERSDDAGLGEFEPFRNDLARSAVAKGGEDAEVTVPAEQLDRLNQIAEKEKQASDALLLGWYHLRRDNLQPAEKWFRSAFDAEQSAAAAEGLALVLIEQGQFAEAEKIMYLWRSESDDSRAVYLASVANLLGLEPRPVLAGEVLNRIVTEVAAARDAAAANQLGWYARAWEQHDTAKAWFTTALGWKPDEEPAAYGLALTYQQMEQTAELAEIKRLWTGRSERIRLIGSEAAATRATTAMAPAPTAAQQPTSTTVTVSPSQPTAAATTTSTPSPAEQAPRVNVAVFPSPQPVVGQEAPSTAGRAPQPTATRVHGCTTHVHPESLSPAAALARGWCLMDVNRPLEAAQAFEVALRSTAGHIRSDASYGQSLAYLRAGLVNNAAVAATKAPQDAGRAVELQTNILAERALGAFERGRYVETLLALDQRAQLAPERVDLMVIRGYAYLRLNRLVDARRVFEAAAGTGSRDAIRALGDLRNMTSGQ